MAPAAHRIRRLTAASLTVASLAGACIAVASVAVASLIPATASAQARQGVDTERPPHTERELESSTLRDDHVWFELLAGAAFAVPLALGAVWAGCEAYHALHHDDYGYDGCEPGMIRGVFLGAGVGWGVGVIVGGYAAGAKDGWWQTLLATAVANTLASLLVFDSGIEPLLGLMLGTAVVLATPPVTFELTAE